MRAARWRFSFVSILFLFAISESHLVSADSRSATERDSTALQPAVLQARLQQCLMELQTNEAVQKQATTTDSQLEILRTRAASLRQKIQEWRAQIGAQSH
jgi:capsule polysaccharide export protein KpsE/RkpR